MDFFSLVQQVAFPKLNELHSSCANLSNESHASSERRFEQRVLRSHCGISLFLSGRRGI